MQLRSVRILAVVIVLLAGRWPAAAQITTGNISGTVQDNQGGIIPGATVVLVSESRGTRSAPVVTNEAGIYVFPNVTADVYTVEVSMDSFKTIRRTGIRVSGGDRVGVPLVTLEPGALAETVNVSAESALVQTQSAERSYAVSTEQIENLPINRQNFTSLLQFAPGVRIDQSGSTSYERLGGVSQNNLMMDGISAMDTGNNGTMLAMNVESIGEVKILTQGYQAEFGRSSGLQVTAVTKSGTNRFRGSVYDVERDNHWNSNSWVNRANGDPKPITDEKDWGYSIGGPVGKPGGINKLFFFYSHEYRPRNTPINNGNPIRLRVPTLLERQGDFSQSRDNNGNLLPQLLDPITRQPFPNNVIPSDRLYQVGLNLLKRYPNPTKEQAPNTNYNYEISPPQVENLIQQPAVRLDYQMTSKLRLNWKYSGDRRRPIITPGLIPGFSDVKTPYPYITNYAVTVNYTMSPTTFIEGTYGFIRNELTGGNENGVLVNDSSNRLKDLAGFPLLYPNAGKVNNDGYYANEVLDAVNPPWWDSANRMMNLPPVFIWGGRIGGANVAPSPPNQRYPGWLNINRTQDVSISITKVAGRHTVKAGFYNNHSFKAQNVGAGGGLSFQGTVDFSNDANNALDTGFGFANAATGVFTRYQQASDFIEGQMIYDNTEFYAQDNWKVSNRLTLDYGLRFTRQGPQYDKYQQMSGFFPELWSSAQAPVLYVPGCSNGAVTCSGNTLNAMDPRNGQILTAAGAANTQAAIGTPIPGSGNALNGIRRAGDGIAKTGYTWPKLVLGPRFGMAYDLTGSQTTVLRAGGGIFYDRPDGNTVFSIPGNPPIASSQDLRNGMLQTLGQGLSTLPNPQLVTFQYEAKVPAQWQWNAGVQRALPWYMSLDLSYVGNHGFNRLGALQGGSTVNLNAIDIGAAYQPQYQDPTRGTSAVPGQFAYTANLLRPYRGFAAINQNTTSFWDTYHSIQTSLNRRFRNGFSFGANYTYGISLKGNTGLQQRLQHNPDGSFQLRADQDEFEKLNENLDNRPHTLKANAVWALPKVPAMFGRAVGLVLNDWRLAGVLSAGSGPTYDLGFGYQGGIGAQNLTGSPDYNARIVYVGDPGSGCSSDQYRQFNMAAVSGPTYNSTQMESGRNRMRACPDKRLDMAVSRDIRVGGGRVLDFRLDVFNVFDTVIYDQRNQNIAYNSPTDLTIRNSQFLADGSLDPTRLQPRNAGFGAATRALPLRSMQIQIRFAF
jgi:Carboxypeptidase regulatory-like domain/TonB-dependent Receptor Plug Domain